MVGKFPAAARHSSRFTSQHRELAYQIALSFDSAVTPCATFAGLPPPRSPPLQKRCQRHEHAHHRQWSERDEELEEHWRFTPIIDA